MYERTTFSSENSLFGSQNTDSSNNATVTWLFTHAQIVMSSKLPPQEY